MGSGRGAKEKPEKKKKSTDELTTILQSSFYGSTVHKSQMIDHFKSALFEGLYVVSCLPIISSFNLFRIPPSPS